MSFSNVSDLEIDFIPISALFATTSEIIEKTINDILANNLAINFDSYKIVNIKICRSDINILPSQVKFGILANQNTVLIPI
jgi:hypothetical protein